MLQLAASPYNRYLLSEFQRESIDVVLVSPRNPLNVGAVARAMANFGFKHLTVVDPYEPHWREARSAVGAPELLQKAMEVPVLADAVGNCSLVIGTGTVNPRKPEQTVVGLDELAPLVTQELDRGGRIAMVFGPEKHGLTREDLSYCHVLVEIPTDRQQPSMNLGQAAAVSLYELSVRAGRSPEERRPAENRADESSKRSETVAEAASTSGNLDLLAELIEEVMAAANYSPNTMQEANRHDLRLTLRRLNLNAHDSRRLLGLFRRILRRLQRKSA